MLVSVTLYSIPNFLLPIHVITLWNWTSSALMFLFQQLSCVSCQVLRLNTNDLFVLSKFIRRKNHPLKFYLCRTLLNFAHFRSRKPLHVLQAMGLLCHMPVKLHVIWLGLNSISGTDKWHCMTFHGVHSRFSCKRMCFTSVALSCSLPFLTNSCSAAKYFS